MLLFVHKKDLYFLFTEKPVELKIYIRMHINIYLYMILCMYMYVRMRMNLYTGELHRPTSNKDSFAICNIQHSKNHTNPLCFFVNIVHTFPIHFFLLQFLDQWERACKVNLFPM